MNIDELNLTRIPFNRLYVSGINTVEQLVEKTEKDLLRIGDAMLEARKK
jgi:DNA-directed RNA polymerase alpha subunit